EADKLIEKITSEKTATAVEDNTNEKSNESISSEAENLIKKETNISETTKTDEAVSNTNNSDSEEKITEVEESDKPSIFDAIEDKNNTEEAVASNDNEPDNRWDVTPNFAPVFYNSLEDGSSIDPSFADNAQSGDVNFSYGIQVAYNVTDKLSVRSGVNNVNLSYTTKGIELGTGPVSAALKSIDYGNKSIVLSAYDKGTLANSTGEADDPFGNVTPKSTNGEAEINQKINYYEIPLELKYSLVNNKFGVNLIGGLSTLFLGNNEISVNAGDFESILGEANNLSTVSFTTNVGVGLNYKFSKKFMFNIEPMFKYQLNPYTDSSVNYKPYYIGIYSGLSFKF
ncbi:MAG: PorT family protein, partial [Flavobacteriaceae bacterium]|nr:PorT family protein [Flavobacteriaceae bacterium]